MHLSSVIVFITFALLASAGNGRRSNFIQKRGLRLLDRGNTPEQEGNKHESSQAEHIPKTGGGVELDFSQLHSTSLSSKVITLQGNDNQRVIATFQDHPQVNELVLQTIDNVDRNGRSRVTAYRLHVRDLEIVEQGVQLDSTPSSSFATSWSPTVSEIRHRSGLLTKVTFQPSNHGPQLHTMNTIYGHGRSRMIYYKLAPNGLAVQKTVFTNGERIRTVWSFHNDLPGAQQHAP